MSARVLVVDDAAFMRHMLKQILVGMGCEIVAEAADGEEGVAAYQTHQPDLVTMDLVMPKMGGLEALQRIKQESPDAKVVVISAIDQRQSLMEAVRYGAADYVVKPFDRERVVQAVGRVLGIEAGG